MSIPISKIRPEDAPFCQDPAISFTLPARSYIDGGIYELEKAAIFYRNWIYAGHKSQLSEVGNFITTRIHEQNVFIIKDKSGELKAFYNVCQHRGHELLSGTGIKKSAIVCPYHSWAYGLDGKLIRARNTDNMKNFDKCDFSLKPVRIEEFCGLVFINLDPDAESLAEKAGELESEIRQYCPSVDEMVFAQRDTYDVDCNWKVMVDNFLECYHCHPAHKDFVDLVDMKTYRSSVNGIYSRHVSNAVRSTENSAYSFEKGEVDFGYAGWFLWPNLTIWIYPGEPNISILQMNPLATEKTVEYQDWFLPGTVPSRQQLAAMEYQKDVLQPEDISLCESVQRGLHSMGYNQGRFVVDDERSELSEHAVHHFQNMVMQALPTLR